MMSAAGIEVPGKDDPQPVQSVRRLLPTILDLYLFTQPKIRTVAMMLTAWKQPTLSPFSVGTWRRLQ